jgi:transposase
MGRLCNTPNAENATLSELQALFKRGSIVTQRRCMGLIMLLNGCTTLQVCKSLAIGNRTLCKWVFAFNHCGIDGLIERKKPVAPKKINDILSTELIEYIHDPTSVGT